MDNKDTTNQPRMSKSEQKRREAMANAQAKPTQVVPPVVADAPTDTNASEVPPKSVGITHPDERRDLPPVQSKPTEAIGEEVPGQPAAVIKNRIEVPNVSHLGEKTQSDIKADEDRKRAEEEAAEKRRAEEEAALHADNPANE